MTGPLNVQYYDANDNLRYFTYISSIFNQNGIPVFKQYINRMDLKRLRERSSWETSLPRDLIEESQRTNVIQINPEQINEYNFSDLNGYATHGIKNNIITLITILKNKHILSQNLIEISTGRHTIYTSDEKHYISFSIVGNKDGAGIPVIYGQNGITFLSNNLPLLERRANMPNEYFIKDKVNINDLIIGIDKDFANNILDDGTCGGLFKDKDKDIDLLNTLGQFIGIEFVIEYNEVENILEFCKFFGMFVDKIINKCEFESSNPLTILDLIKCLVKYYNLNITIILIDYTK